MKINFSYLKEQFCEEEAGKIWAKIRPVVLRGDFTLGREVELFEQAYASKCGVAHAIGVNSGTDALALPLMALDIRGQVICPAFSFVATAGAIVQAGATPAFCDVGEDMNIDVDKIEERITGSTEAIMPVWWGGRPPRMDRIMELAHKHHLVVIGDCAQALGSSWQGLPAGTWGDAASFSLHPLKVVNGWADGGVICTDDDDIARKLRLLRNHGLSDRDTCRMFGVNSRLDTINAVVSHHVLSHVDAALAKRAFISQCLFDGLACNNNITLPMLPIEAGPNWYLFTMLARSRNHLMDYLLKQGIEAKIHYPIPLHLQPASAYLGYVYGSFPGAERAADETISLPNHEYLTQEDADYMVAAVRSFYEEVS